MARADMPIPPLTHYSPSGSESGLPVTPNAASPPALFAVDSDYAARSPSPGPVRNIRAAKRMAAENITGGPSAKKQFVDEGIMGGEQPPVRLAVKNTNKGTRNGKGSGKGKVRENSEVAQVVQAGADDEDEEGYGDMINIAPEHKHPPSPSKFRLPGTVCTTFIIPSLQYSRNHLHHVDQWSQIFFGIQQYFVYSEYEYLEIFHTQRRSNSFIHIVTHEELLDSFEAVVKTIVREILDLSASYSIRVQRSHSDDEE